MWNNNAMENARLSPPSPAGTAVPHPARYRAPALDKGLDILELLAGQPSGMTRAEIVKAMGRGPSEIYRMIERLVARRYLSRSPEGDRYLLTMKLFLLGSAHPPVRRLVAQAQPAMDAFARARAPVGASRGAGGRPRRRRRPGEQPRALGVPPARRRAARPRRHRLRHGAARLPGPRPPRRAARPAAGRCGGGAGRGRAGCDPWRGGIGRRRAGSWSG
jgi:hypothetical protein